MKKQKAVLLPVLMLMLLVSLSVPTNAASSVSAVPVNKPSKKVVRTEKIEMETNDSIWIELTVKGKAVWTTSNPKVVSVKPEGKNNRTGIFSTGNRTGTCTVKATVKNKVYKYKVTVKKGKIIKDYKGTVSKAVFDSMTKNYTVNVRFCNASKSVKWYGYIFSLQRYENGKWKTVPMKQECLFPSLALKVPAKKSVTYSYPLASYYAKKELRKGTYIICTDYVVKPKNTHVKFKIS